MEFTAKGHGPSFCFEANAKSQPSRRVSSDSTDGVEFPHDMIGEGIDRALRFFDTHSLSATSILNVLHHGVRTCDLAVQIGTVLSLPSAELSILQLAALTHDIGKSMVPRRIRDKQRPMSILELGAARLHTLFGSKLLETMFNDQPNLARRLSDVAMFHHDRWDGKNSLSGIRGAEIPRLARIVAVADVYDALVSDLRHRSKGSLDRAASCVTQERERQFDPECVDALLQIATRSPIDEHRAEVPV